MYHDSIQAFELILSPIIKVCISEDLKINEPMLYCIQKLVACGYLRGQLDLIGGLYIKVVVDTDLRNEGMG